MEYQKYFDGTRIISATPKAYEVIYKAQGFKPFDVGNFTLTEGVKDDKPKSSGNDNSKRSNNVEYAGHVEHGHRVKINGKFTSKVVAGKHMLKKAIEESQSQFDQDGRAILNSIFKG